MKKLYCSSKLLVLFFALVFNYSAFASFKIIADTSSVIYGCMDTTSLNYNPNATVSNGSCIAIVYGCTNPSSSNYNPQANYNNGTCIIADTSSVIYGCMDTTSLNYNPNATVSNGSCIAIVYGCTNPSASNYNPQANYNNGTCIIADTLTIIYGCTNPNAFNYNPYATNDNGSCFSDTIVIFGCTDPNSINFNPSATTNNGSCTYDTTIVNISGCTDPLAYTYNGYANIMDNSCLYNQIQINTDLTIVKSELKDTIGSVVFNNCEINYALDITNAYIDNIVHVGFDSVTVTWAIIQNDGIKTITSNYFVTTIGKQLFILTVACAQNPNARTTGPSTTGYIITFGDVATITAITTGVFTSTASTGVFKLFPQPATNSINFSTNEVGSLTILTLQGEEVLSTTINSLNGEVNVSGLNPGCYLYRYSGASSFAAGKLIKE